MAIVSSRASSSIRCNSAANEDFAHYPRTPSRDADMLAAAGCDLMFMPDVGEMYGAGSTAPTRVEVPGISTTLCGEFRPGHFVGVATVVAKLFNIVQPDVALFGEKVFQQLVVIRRMAADLCFPIAIIGAPTVREEDKLALSSRNVYLSLEECAQAPVLQRALAATARGIASGGLAAPEAARAHFLTVFADATLARLDYFEIVDASTLEPLESFGANELRLLAAAFFGKTRLIDNVGVS